MFKGWIMREITKEMVKNFKIMKLGYDFMGYKVDRTNNLSFHHLIIPHKDCHKYGLGEGYLYWNGAILVQDTSHDYLHIIQQYDEEIFYHITSEMIDQNIKGRLDEYNLKKIHDLLNYFENEHMRDKTSKGKVLIKHKYLDRIYYNK